MDFKYFVKVKKAYSEDGDWFVKGIASGTLTDQDGEQMSVDVLKAFVDSFPLPLTNSHPRAGEIMGDLGEASTGRIIEKENGDYELEIEGRLDKDNPACAYLVKKIQDGKKFAFSIQGKEPEIQTVWDDVKQKFVTLFTKVIPTAVSITSEPSYLPSFLEVMTKSVKKVDNNDTSKEDQNINSDNITMKEEKKTQPTEEVKEEVKQDTPEAPETSESATGEVEEKKEEKEEVKKAKKDKKGDMSMTDKMYSMMKSLKESVDTLTKTQAAVKKSVVEQAELLKSQSEEIEGLKKVTSGKKSRVVSKAYDDAQKAEDKPDTIKGIVEGLL